MLNDFPLASTNLVAGTGGVASSLTLPSRAVAILVPTPPGVLIIFLISSTVGFGSLSVRKARAA